MYRVAKSPSVYPRCSKFAEIQVGSDKMLSDIGIVYVMLVFPSSTMLETWCQGTFCPGFKGTLGIPGGMQWCRIIKILQYIKKSQSVFKLSQLTINWCKVTWNQLLISSILSLPYMLFWKLNVLFESSKRSILII